MKTRLTRLALQQVLDFKDNQFFWKQGRGRASAGSRAGHMSGKERRIVIDRSSYLESTLAYLWHTGNYFECIEFIDPDTRNLTLANLNPIPSTLKGKHPGIYNLNNKVWEVHVWFEGIKKYVGRFPSFNKAQLARASALRALKNGHPIPDSPHGNSTGKVGVSRVSSRLSDTGRALYEASISHNKVRYFLGRYEEIGEAVSAREKAEEHIANGDLEALGDSKVSPRPQRFCETVDKKKYCEYLTETKCAILGVRFRKRYNREDRHRCHRKCPMPFCEETVFVSHTEPDVPTPPEPQEPLPSPSPTPTPTLLDKCEYEDLIFHKHPDIFRPIARVTFPNGYGLRVEGPVAGDIEGWNSVLVLKRDGSSATQKPLRNLTPEQFSEVAEIARNK